MSADRAQQGLSMAMQIFAHEALKVIGNHGVSKASLDQHISKHKGKVKRELSGKSLPAWPYFLQTYVPAINRASGESLTPEELMWLRALHRLARRSGAKPKWHMSFQELMDQATCLADRVEELEKMVAELQKKLAASRNS